MEENYYLAFSLFPGIGPKRFSQLLAYFSSAKQIWEGDEKNLKTAGMGEKTLATFLEFRKTFSFEKHLADLERNHVVFVTSEEEAYPQLLKDIPNPPFVLYCKGNVSLLSSWGLRAKRGGRQDLDSGLRQNDNTKSPGVGSRYIAVVGTRKISSYGRQVTEMFTRDLVLNGFVIVSGLAMGVDAVAHQTTIDSGGKTIAVLGCGVDCCTPPSNEKLYDEIISSGGLIVSEFPLHMGPTIGSFPSRNRIIAGLSQAVLVTEGAEDSGALITAGRALEIGRPAFAIPGPITSSLSKGPFKLIQQGGKLVTSTEDALEELKIKSEKLKIDTKKEERFTSDNREEQSVIDALANENLHMDELSKQTNIGTPQLATILSMMELKGMLKVDSLGNYCLVH